MKRVIGIEDEADVEGEASEDEKIRPENAYDRLFINSDPVAEYTKRNKRFKHGQPSLFSEAEHKPDPDPERKHAKNRIRFGNYAASFTPVINSETNAAMKDGHAELSLFHVQTNRAGTPTKIEQVKGIKVEVSAMPEALKLSYVDILTFNVNTLQKRDNVRVRDLQATIIGVMCSSFAPGIIIKSCDGWMEFEGEVNGEKSLNSMAKRFEGIYYVDPDSDAIVFHAGEFEKYFRSKYAKFTA